MAIQQLATIQLNLLGDGVATVFTYSFNKLYETTLGDGGFITAPYTLPTSAVLTSTTGPLPSGNATLDGFGNLILTFNSAWSGIGTATVQLDFASGTLSGTTAAWTSATAANTTWTLPLNGSNSVEIGFVVSGTVTAGTLLFEVSQDGAAWFPVQGALSNSYTSLTGWTPGVGSLPVQFDVSGFAYIRLRLNPVITGSGTVTFIIQSSSTSIEPVPVVGQANGINLHTTLDDAAGGNSVNTVAKGTQAARALGVQSMLDAGRTYVAFTAVAAAGVTAEALLSVSQNKQGVNTAAQTNYTVTTGKTLRITSISVSVRAGAAAFAFARVALRHNTAGATTAASPIAYLVPEVISPAALAGAGGTISCPVPEGIEFYGNGTQTIGISHLDQATTNILNVTVYGYEY